MQYRELSSEQFNDGGIFIADNVLDLTVENRGKTTAYVQPYQSSRIPVPPGKAISLGNSFYPECKVSLRIKFAGAGSSEVIIYYNELKN